MKPIRATSLTRRRKTALETFGSAAEAIGPIKPGLSLFLLTRGQFAMLDMVAHVVEQIGRCQVSVWTWAIAAYEVEAMGGLMGNKAITGARLVVDRSAEHRNAEIIRQWRKQFGPDQVRICKNHAKVARVWNDRFHVLLRGSMNLNHNPRFEQADITEGCPAFDLVGRVEDELPVLRPMCAVDEANAASKLDLVFSADDLKPFDGAKPWAK